MPPPAAAPAVRVCARSHAGRASSSLALPASVIVTSFSRRSSPLRTAIQPASTSGRRLRVSVVSSSDVSSAQVPLPDLARTARGRWSSEYWVVRRPTPRNSSS